MFLSAASIACTLEKSDEMLYLYECLGSSSTNFYMIVDLTGRFDLDSL